MSLATALDRYFAAWNDHDPAAVVASLADDGTYEDPTTNGPLHGDALARSVAGLVAGFPDLHFDLLSVAPTGPTSAAAQWVMRGTNTGPMLARPATLAAVALSGADFIGYDPVAGRLTKVVGYFDTASLLVQLGLQAHVSPADAGPVTFGTSSRIDTDRPGVPAGFSVTWIELDPEHHATLTEASTRIVTEQLGNVRYLGSCFATVGRRHYTFTAWQTVDAARAALRGGAHAAAMRLARAGGLGDDAVGVTSLWRPEVINGVFRPGVGESRDRSGLDGQWL